MNDSMSRRVFIRQCVAGGLGTAACLSRLNTAFARPPRRRKALPLESLKESMFYESLDNGHTICLMCPNRCERNEGGITLCKTRINRGGKLYTMTYARPCMIVIDPLEKNPLYHVAPGHNALATATAGCNLSCSYCQNWDIALVGPDETRNMDVTPEALVSQAVERGLKWLTFSYTEPVAYYEYALDSAEIAHQKGLKVAVVTAGYINRKPLEALMKTADAFSVTLKGYTQSFYQDVCGGNLNDVWRTIRTLVQSGKWVEVVNLIVPGMNDEEKGLRTIGRSLAGLKKDIPLHFLRFSPAYKLKHLPSTPVKTLEKARAIAQQEGMKYVYLSNLHGHAGANTTCPSCKKVLIERVGFKILSNRVSQGRCSFCRYPIAGFDLG